MVFLSTLRASPSLVRSVINCRSLIRPNYLQAIRHGGGGPQKMLKTPTQFQARVFKDDLHYYFMLGIIPLVTLIALTDLFVGPAQLSDIPEDYEPKEDEYYKHPIERFFVRHLYPSMPETYEKAASEAFMEQEKMKFRKLERKVRLLMSQRGDYKAWYYVPNNTNIVVAGRKSHLQVQSEIGTHQ